MKKVIWGLTICCFAVWFFAGSCEHGALQSPEELAIVREMDAIQMRLATEELTSAQQAELHRRFWELRHKLPKPEPGAGPAPDAQIQGPGKSD